MTVTARHLLGTLAPSAAGLRGLPVLWSPPSTWGLGGGDHDGEVDPRVAVNRWLADPCEDYGPVETVRDVVDFDAMPYRDLVAFATIGVAELAEIAAIPRLRAPVRTQDGRSRRPWFERARRESR